MPFQHFHWWKIHFYLPLLLAGVLLTLTCCTVVFHYTAEEMKQHVTYMGESKMAGLSEDLERYLTISKSQENFVIREHGDIDPQRYMAQISTLFYMGDALVYMGLAPDGVVAYEFPKDYLQAENRNLNTSPRADKAKQARKMHTSVSFLQPIPGFEGTEIVAYRPIFLPDRTTDGQFWGYSILILNKKKLMEETRMNSLTSTGLHYSLTRTDKFTGETAVVDSNGPVAPEAIRIHRLINGHQWTLSLSPEHGFGDQRLLFAFLWSGLLTTLVFSYLAASIRRSRREGRRDPLTGLFNRKGGDELVAAYMETNPHTRAAVLFMDIDNFKVINDVYGHQTGDRALIQFARDIRSTFGKDAIITRNGGDEFVVYLPYDAKDVLFHRMDTFCHEPHWVKDKKENVRFTASLGCALYPQHANNYSQLCIEADFALYSAKLNGKSKWHLYNPKETKPSERTQFGFNLSDIAGGMPGAMIVYQAEGDYKILFANQKMVDLYECSSYEDFISYLENDGRRLVHPDERDKIRSEIRAKEKGDNAGKPGFVTYRILTHKGNVRTVDTIGTLAHNDLFGDVYYVFLYPHGLRD